ncbi:MAG: hypothetical protein ABWX59_11180 [Microbacteriaceae bacterium]
MRNAAPPTTETRSGAFHNRHRSLLAGFVVAALTGAGVLAFPLSASAEEVSPPAVEEIVEPTAEPIAEAPAEEPAAEAPPAASEPEPAPAAPAEESAPAEEPASEEPAPAVEPEPTDAAEPEAPAEESTEQGATEQEATEPDSSDSEPSESPAPATSEEVATEHSDEGEHSAEGEDVADPRVWVDETSCPGTATINLRDLDESVRYIVKVDDEFVDAIKGETKASVDVEDLDPGKHTVTVWFNGKKFSDDSHNDESRSDRGERKHVEKDFWTKPCPDIHVKINDCSEPDGDASIRFWIDDLSEHAWYRVTLKNNDTGDSETWDVSDSTEFGERVDVDPGTDYTLTVKGKLKHGGPIGPVSKDFETAECPEDVAIEATVTACPTVGEVEVTVSNLVEDTEYTVSVTGEDDVTFVADSDTETFTFTDLEPGSYEVTVTTNNGSGKHGDHKPRVVSEKFTVPECEVPVTPPVPPAPPAPPAVIQPTVVAPAAILPVTGGDASGLAFAGLVLLPLGAAMMAVASRRRRLLSESKG